MIEYGHILISYYENGYSRLHNFDVVHIWYVPRPILETDYFSSQPYFFGCINAYFNTYLYFYEFWTNLVINLCCTQSWSFGHYEMDNATY